MPRKDTNSAVCVKVSWDSGIPRDLGTYKLEPAMAEVILDTESENYYGYMLKVMCYHPVSKKAWIPTDCGRHWLKSSWTQRVSENYYSYKLKVTCHFVHCKHFFYEIPRFFVKPYWD